jgi:hypothetical protein
MFSEPFDSALKRAFLPSFNLGIRQVTTNSKAMSTSVEIFPLVSWSELATSKDFISLRLSFEGELLVHCTGIKEKGSLRVREVFLRAQMAI